MFEENEQTPQADEAVQTELPPGVSVAFDSTHQAVADLRESLLPPGYAFRN
jgi:hypothetical protein